VAARTVLPFFGLVFGGCRRLFWLCLGLGLMRTRLYSDLGLALYEFGNFVAVLLAVA
jgi:hypothetical protein